MKHFILCLLWGSLVVAAEAEAQLSQLPGPFGGKVDGLYQEGNKIYASSPFGLYVSTDDGYHWSSLKITLPSALRSTRLLFKKSNILLMEMVTGTGEGGLHRSTDEGKTFERIFDSSTYSLAQVGEELWLARKSIGLSSDKRNFIRSSDFGKTWIEQPRPAGGWVYHVASDGKNIFCIAASNKVQKVVWRSFDNGVTWDSLHGRPQANNRWSFAEDYQPISLASVITGSDTTLWVGFMPQAKRPMKLPTLYRVNNRDSLLEPIPSVIDGYISQIVTTPRYVFAVASGSLLKYDIAADTLLDITYNLHTSYFGTGTIFPIQASLEGDVLVGFVDGIARLNSQLASYARSDSGLTASPVSCLLSHNDTLYAVTAPYLRKHRLWASPDRGQSWELLDYRAEQSLQIVDITPVSNGLLIGHDTTIDLLSNGTYTTLTNLGIYNTSQFHSVGDTIYCRSYYDWSMSTDEGATWSYRGRASVSHLNDNCSIVGPGHHIFQCGGYGTVVRSSDGALTWDTISTAPYVLTNAGQPAVSGDALFIMGRTQEKYWAVLRSDDLGRSWKQIVGQLHYSGVLYPLGGKLFYGTNQGLFICGLNGENPAPVSGPTGNVASIAHDDVNLYVGTTGAGVWKIALATLGIQASVAKSISAATELILTPNPATDHITIDESGMVTIINMAGVTLFHAYVSAGERIDISFLPKGPYMLRVGNAAPAMLAVE